MGQCLNFDEMYMVDKRYVTVVTTPQPCGKQAELVDGVIKFTSKGNVVAGTARTVHVPTADALAAVLSKLGNNQYVIPDFIEAYKDGKPFQILIAYQYKQMFPDQVVPGAPIERDGKRFAALQPGVWTFGGWRVLDRDVDTFTPSALAALSYPDFLKQAERLLPGLLSAPRVHVPSSKGRVRGANGESFASPNSHTWVMVADSALNNPTRQNLLVNAFDIGLGWAVPRRSKSSGAEMSGNGLSKTIFDVGIWTDHRIIYGGAPTVGTGLELLAAQITPIDGTPLHLSDVPTPTTQVFNRLKERTGVEGKLGADGGAVLVDNTSLALDTILELKINGRAEEMSVENFLVDERIVIGEGYRAQTPFRESDSWNAIVRKQGDDAVMVHDNGTATTFYLRLRSRAEDDFADDLATTFANENDDETAFVLRPEILAEMNEVIGVRESLIEGGFEEQEDHALYNAKLNKVAKQQPDGRWTIGKLTNIDGAALLIKTRFGGDELKAQILWRNTISNVAGGMDGLRTLATQRGHAQTALGIYNAFLRPVGDSMAHLSAIPATLEAIEYSIDGFLGAGVTYIGGGQGIGKTSLLVPLASIVSGEINGFEADLVVELPRKVIYVTEDPDQAKRVRYGLKKHCNLLENGNFIITQAQRRTAAQIQSLTEKLVAKYTGTGPNGYKVKPLIVFDTTNACFDVDNENDAAMVGSIMSALKIGGGGAPIWIVGHLAKALMRAEFEDMTGRGSGAWEADAQTTAFIFADAGEDNVRHMGTKKRRFEAKFGEIRFETTTDTEEVSTAWGTKQMVPFRYGVPGRSSKADRKAAAVLAKQRDERAKLEAAKQVVRNFLSGQLEAVCKSAVEEGCADTPRAAIREALKSMIVSGEITADNPYTSAQNRTTHNGLKLVVLNFDDLPEGQ